ncbi:hypothetical protein EXIGLDRAFT_726992 [Exidia glandulosa HHB12029]|uniref:Uncharacterized protein n=1 Tax=Exidia glandulosa HHB12029 TaxID=1314781 RepID=A0A165ZP82_EXIGL|nr:hypothetical protein EXIGLDRAFT_726992 [Exidia glandulosa HHB12029]
MSATSAEHASIVLDGSHSSEARMRSAVSPSAKGGSHKFMDGAVGGRDADAAVELRRAEMSVATNVSGENADSRRGLYVRCIR